MSMVYCPRFLCDCKFFFNSSWSSLMSMAFCVSLWSLTPLLPWLVTPPSSTMLVSMDVTFFNDFLVPNALTNYNF